MANGWVVARCLCSAVFVAAALLLPRPVAAADDPAALLGRVVELTNQERLKAGLMPLALNAALGQAAQSYAEVLAAGTCWAHTCGAVPDFAQRITNAGYTGWSTVGENLAGGQRTPEAVVAAWMASPGHRANILNGAYLELGLGLALGSGYGIYWTQEFGARRSVAAPPSPPAPRPAGSAPSTPAGAAPVVSPKPTAGAALGGATGAGTPAGSANPALAPSAALAADPVTPATPGALDATPPAAPETPDAETEMVPVDGDATLVWEAGDDQLEPLGLWASVREPAEDEGTLGGVPVVLVLAAGE